MENEEEKRKDSKEQEDADQQPKRRYVAPEVTVLGDVTTTTGACGCGGGSLTS